MSRKRWWVVAAVAVAIVAWFLISSPREKRYLPPPPPPVEIRTLSPQDILTWEEDSTRPVVLVTKRDALPGGLSAAMVPVFVDWQASDLEQDDPVVILRNVNHGGNPIEGTTVLRSARLHLNGLKAVDLIMVPLGKGGRHAATHHMQLRFIFDEGHPIELLDKQIVGKKSFNDLVLSWEAWRPPGSDYSMLKGMLPNRYALSLRAFSGPQRFLEDALARRPWYGFHLRMPGGQEGLRELLKVSLVLGDGVARHETGRILQEGEEVWATHAPRGTLDADQAHQRWEQLRRKLSVVKVSDDPWLNLPPQDRSYQTLLRSCASMARYAVVTAAARLAARGFTDGLNPQHMPTPQMPQVEPWMKEIAEADLGGIFLRAPTALSYLLHHPEVIPSKIPGELDDMGLMQRSGEKMETVTWSLKNGTPYPLTALVR